MPKVEPTILKWARETSKLSLEEASHKLQLKNTKKESGEEKLLAYENGQKEPPRALLVKMSQKYHQPLLTFYLNKQPTKGDRGEDFRTLPPQIKEVENAYADILVRNIKARQSVIRETLIDADEEKKNKFHWQTYH